ncbi:hypothetical protein XU18_1134 [Perkinsela sp. CCAP 1560/4]|nr:hypothetical protein XU18_1134 [Perkinsela sp. CCAP 1560/4]|eukprot:KNH08325.1 hypothetical protein XU18_1134 [Perkinsela sp. CCAP 1560/4]
MLHKNTHAGFSYITWTLSVYSLRYEKAVHMNCTFHILKNVQRNCGKFPEGFLCVRMPGSTCRLTSRYRRQAPPPWSASPNRHRQSVAPNGTSKPCSMRDDLHIRGVCRDAQQPGWARCKD